MKIYVKANSNNPIEVFTVIVDIGLPESIHSSADESDRDKPLIDSKTGKLIDALYEHLLETVEEKATEMGLTYIRKKNSEYVDDDGDLSNSIYYDFCIEDNKNAKTIRFICFLRISDHPDKNGNHQKHAKDRLKDYEDSDEYGSNNSASGHLKPFYRKITIDENRYNSVNSAMIGVENLFSEYIESEGMPYIYEQVVDYLDSLYDDLEEETRPNNKYHLKWKMFDNVANDGDISDFAIRLIAYKGSTELSSFDVRFVYRPKKYGECLRVTIMRENSGWTQLCRVSLPDPISRTTVFDSQEMKSLFQDFIVPEMKRIDEKYK